MQQKECSFLSSNDVDANASGGQSVPAAHVSADLISKMDLRGCGEAIGVAFTATLSWLPPECPNSLSKHPFWNDTIKCRRFDVFMDDTRKACACVGANLSSLDMRARLQ